MATAVEQYGKEPVVKTKAAEIKTLLHKQIIDVGEDVYKRTNERQQQLFDDFLLKHESKLLQKLDQQKQKTLDEQQKKHNDELKRIKEEYIEKQDAALKAQAKRVEKILIDRVRHVVAETQLEGQRRLDEALIEAREKFDMEKKECIEKLVRKLQKDFDQRLKEEQTRHKTNIRELNDEWSVSMEENNKLSAQKMVTGLEKQRKELDKKHAENTEKQLKELEENHKQQIDKCDKQIKVKREENENLSNEIEKLKGDLRETKHSMRIVMETFREFIESCDGFGVGQADFVLDNLIPEKIEDFLRS